MNLFIWIGYMERPVKIQTCAKCATDELDEQGRMEWEQYIKKEGD